MGGGSKWTLPKATKVDVTGVLVDGVGYGAATVKKVGGVGVTVE